MFFSLNLWNSKNVVKQILSWFYCEFQIVFVPPNSDKPRKIYREGAQFVKETLKIFAFFAPSQ